MKVYLLFHEDIEYIELIQIYATKELAEKALKKLKNKDDYFIVEDEIIKDSSIPMYGIK